MAVRVNQSFHSRGSVISVRPASVTRRRRSSGLSLKRKLLTAPTILPSSIKYTPSRVSPVNSSVVGSTSRMYQRVVSSRPFSVPAIMSSIEVSSPPVRMRLSPGTATGRPNSRAAWRGYASALTTPSRTQSTGSISIPLSNSETDSLDDVVITNGADCKPSAPGSEVSVSGNPTFSPIRVPPVVDSAVWPSSAPRPSMVHIR